MAVGRITFTVRDESGRIGRTSVNIRRDTSSIDNSPRTWQQIVNYALQLQQAYYVAIDAQIIAASYSAPIDLDPNFILPYPTDGSDINELFVFPYRDTTDNLATSITLPGVRHSLFPGGATDLRVAFPDDEISELLAIIIDHTLNPGSNEIITDSRGNALYSPEYRVLRRFKR